MFGFYKKKEFKNWGVRLRAAAGMVLLGVVLSGCGKDNTLQTTMQNDTADLATAQSDMSQSGTVAGDTGETAIKEDSPVQSNGDDTLTVPDKTTDSADDPGVYHLSLLAEKSLESYDSSRVKEIIMEPEGASFVFWTEKTLTDLKLIGVDYDGDQFMEKETYCSYDEFTPEDALLITHFFSEDMADLKLTFFDDQGQAQAFYITQDGQNATPVMVSETALLF